MIVLTASDLACLVDRPATIAAVRQGLIDIVDGTACQPAPTSMFTPADDGRSVLMSALSDRTGTVMVKLLTDLPGNAARGLATQRSTIGVVDRITGEPIAFLHGGVPTRVRTAAASAVATAALARPDSATLGLIGAGALAIEHVHALRSVLPFERLVVCSRTKERAMELVDTVRWEGPTEVLADPEDVLAAADVVCTLTPSATPVVCGDWLRPGQHLNVVGARPRPEEREVDGVAMGRASVWVDDRGTSDTKSGDLLLAIAEGALTADDVVGTVGEVLTGRCRGRADDADITLFDSVGIGALDLAIADVMVAAAKEQGIGMRIDMGA